jgi:hypothetical protein
MFRGYESTFRAAVPPESGIHCLKRASDEERLWCLSSTLDAVFWWATGSATASRRQAVWLAGPTLPELCRMAWRRTVFDAFTRRALRLGGEFSLFRGSI